QPECACWALILGPSVEDGDVPVLGEREERPVNIHLTRLSLSHPVSPRQVSARLLGFCLERSHIVKGVEVVGNLRNHLGGSERLVRLQPSTETDVAGLDLVAAHLELSKHEHAVSRDHDLWTGPSEMHERTRH